MAMRQEELRTRQELTACIQSRNQIQVEARQSVNNEFIAWKTNLDKPGKMIDCERRRVQHERDTMDAEGARLDGERAQVKEVMTRMKKETE